MPTAFYFHPKVFPFTISDGLAVPFLDDLAPYKLGPEIDSGCYLFNARPFKTQHKAVDKAIAGLFDSPISVTYDIDLVQLPENIRIFSDGKGVSNIPGSILVEMAAKCTKTYFEYRKEYQKRYQKANGGKYAGKYEGKYKYEYAYRNEGGKTIKPDEYRTLPDKAGWVRTKIRIQ